VKRGRKNEAGKPSGGHAEETMEAEGAAPRSRRDFLKYGGAAAVGLVAGAVLDGDEASAEDNKLKLNERNEAFSPTILHADTTGKGATFQAENSSVNEGVALQAYAPNGAIPVVGAGTSAGVVGAIVDEGQGTAVLGHIGEGSQGTGVEGESPGGTGVQGSTVSGFGVIGAAGNEFEPGTGNGVYGYTDSGTGVVGESNLRDGVRGITGAGPEFPEGPYAGVHGVGDDAIGVLGEGAQAGVRGLSGDGSGVVGISTTGHGVYGETLEGPIGGPGQERKVGVQGVGTNTIGVEGISTTESGVHGRSEQDIGVDGDGPVGVHGTGAVFGVEGESENGIGIRGGSIHSAGIEGESTEREGVRGRGTTGVRGFGGFNGVAGEAPAGNPGVLAESRSNGELDHGLAFEARGRARFSNAGIATISDGQSQSEEISPPEGYGQRNQVIVTFAGNPGGPYWVEGAKSTFRVHLAEQADGDIEFVYLVVEIPEDAS